MGFFEYWHWIDAMSPPTLGGVNIDAIRAAQATLVGLLDPGAIKGTTDEKHLYLRNVAHHAGMDYLTKMPENISRGIPDSLDSYSQRAQRVTSVLDEILRKQPVPQQPALSS